jgi:acetyltransferase-like isoleucine patch superfamily enzyme
VIPIVVPTTDVNSETCVIVAWHVDDGERVERDQLLVEAETSKALIEIIAPEGGLLLREWPEGAEVALGGVVARLFPDQGTLELYREEMTRRVPEPERAHASDVKATRRAIQLAQEHGIDLSQLNVSGIVTAEDVERSIRTQRIVVSSSLPLPLMGQPGKQRVLIVGGGYAATQILDIYAHRNDFQAVAVVDDDVTKWGGSCSEIPIIGGSDRMAELFEKRTFDAAVISIGSSVAVRARFRKLCEDLGIPLANAIHPTASLAHGVTLGNGNVICAFCHFGFAAVLGDNNFLSAYNSFDHHCQLGSDISTGPGCMASGNVRIGDRVRMGTGVFIEPNLEIGDAVRIASGVVLMQSVPMNHTVKVRTGQFAVVPDRNP